MKCKTIKLLIYDYSHGEIVDSSKEIVERHLAKCKSCEKEYLEIVALKNLFKAEEVKVPSSILKNIKSQIKQQSTLRDIIFRPVSVAVFSLSFALLIGIFSFNTSLFNDKSNSNDKSSEYLSFYKELYDISSIATDTIYEQSEGSGLLALNDIYEY